MNRVVINMDAQGCWTVYSDEPIEFFCVNDHCPDDRVYQMDVEIGVEKVRQQLGNDPVGHKFDSQTLGAGYGPRKPPSKRKLEVVEKPAPKAKMTPSQAVLDVMAERRRQVEVEHWTPGHDDAHSDGELARAASCYAYFGSWGDGDRRKMRHRFPQNWPWERAWWKPKSPRQDLVRAGALIVAEIERLDRAATTEGSDG